MTQDKSIIEDVQEEKVSLRDGVRTAAKRTRMVFRELTRISPRLMPILLANALVQSGQIGLAIYLPKLLIDAVTRQMPWQQAMGLVGILVLAEVLLKLGQGALAKAISSEQVKVQNGVTLSIAMKVTRLPYSYLEDPEILTLKESAAFALQNQDVAVQLFLYAQQVLQYGLTIIMLLGVLSQLSVGFIAFLLVCFVVAALLQNSLKTYETNFFLNLVGVNRKYGYLMDQAFDEKNQQPIRLYSLEPLLSSQIEGTNREICNWMAVYLKHSGLVSSAQSALADLQAAVAYGYAGLRVLTNVVGPPITLGQFSLYAGAAIQFAQAMRQLFDALRYYKQQLDYLEPYQRFMELPERGTSAAEARRSKGTARAAGAEGTAGTSAGAPSPESSALGNSNRHPIRSIEFEDVTFTYPGGAKPVLKNLSFSIRQGEKISIVGLNGAGKTTLVKLLCRFFEPDSGRILVNGTDIAELPEDQYLREIAAVFQDFRLLPFSIKSNVASLPDSEISEETEREVAATLAKTSISEAIAELPKGMDTLLNKSVNPEGTELSGGQAQKLAIARALFKDGSLVILDEPTSALDPLAEAEIYEHFDTLVQGQTAIYISHRMSSSRFCDKVLVIDAGEMAGFASHNELIKDSDSLYSRLFHEQAKYYQLDSNGAV